MNTEYLTVDEVLAGYDDVVRLYPAVPSLSHWRAWERAAYRRQRLDGRVLDLGCGDGRYFRLNWPSVREAVGVDVDPAVAQLGRASGVYSAVHQVPASRVPEPDASFDHAFANCSLEHMDELDGVLSEVFRCLRPGGTLLCSVVTDKFIEWSMLPRMVAEAGFPERARELQDQFLDLHHLANPLTPAQWCDRFAKAGLAIETHLPILPMFNTGFFLFVDSVWHVRRPPGGELGEVIHPFLERNPRFADGFRDVLKGLITMESDWNSCGGAVFLTRRPR